MADIWLCSDWHLGHSRILEFKDKDGHFIRGNDFSCIEEHDEKIIEEHNKLVKPNDKVYNLGDVFLKDGAKHLNRFNGLHRICVGNHDVGKMQELLMMTQKIGLWRIFRDHGFVASHVPLHPSQIKYYKRGNSVINVHGHLHQNLVLNEKWGKPDPMYINICMEHTLYKPIHIEEVLDHKSLYKVRKK